MSAQKTYNIRCPKCGHEQKVELYESINVAQQPELKTALFENRLNRVQCGSCDASFRVDKPLLYHDADRNILIHWMPDTAVSREEILDEFDKSMEELRKVLPDDVEPPRVRLVFTRAELVELLTDNQIDYPEDAADEHLQQLAIIAIDDEEIDALDDWREAAQELCNDNPREIYQWFRVSSWLAGKLQEIGEPVLDNDFGYWWGRTCCGQAIILDGTMQQIARRTLAE